MKKRKDIIQTATRLFASQGFDGTTTLQIAREANVTEPLIYYHFEGKDDLFTHIVAQAFQEYQTQLESLPSESQPFDQLKHLIDLHFRFVSQKRDEIYLCFNACPAKLKDPESVCKKNLAKQHRWLLSYLKKCIEAGIRQKDFQKVPVTETAQLILSLIHGLVIRQRVKSESLKRLNRATLEFCRRSLMG